MVLEDGYTWFSALSRLVGWLLLTSTTARGAPSLKRRLN